ncbi:MoaD/ThiS family protein [Thermobifida cellulosilytica]|jgi:Molybdopterin converting factor, small subunit|uniref:Thiamine biosynthesis protein ThiS n=1 Tax=Thermobifida cellulosilytica TB100 TaxID=665004 RepID=A0A147KLJ6_THECS|nr:MoaD/ThiS family protein [Thermobifida cellulosilytica]KUP98101.1 thiamine biosynthesis protein ThiS [Thermobifida cellulosilytica TB100]
MSHGTIRYWAAAKAAAGRAEEAFAAGTLEDLLGQVRRRYEGNATFLKVLDRSSLLVNSTAVGRRPHDQVVLEPGWTVEVLPPFAGG